MISFNLKINNVEDLQYHTHRKDHAQHGQLHECVTAHDWLLGSVTDQFS